TVKRIEDLPVSRLRPRSERRPAGAGLRALRGLGRFPVTGLDVNSVQAGSDGGIYDGDRFSLGPAGAPKSAGVSITRAAVPARPSPQVIALPGFITTTWP